MNTTGRRSLRPPACLALLLSTVFCVSCTSSGPTRADSIHPTGEPAGTGTASYYGPGLHGRKTASGERFDMHALTAAHRTLPFGTRVRVTHLGNGRSVVVRINDRGPFRKGRIIDLSRQAAAQIGMIEAGTARVRLDVLR